MSSKTASLHSLFSIDGEVSDGDTRFLRVTIDVLHDGENLNGSYFSKEVVDSCIDSIKNTPVLGFIEYNETSGEYDFKGHEYVLAMTKDGLEQKYLGSCYGIIPESCHPRWVTRMSSDGNERQYLQVDALLWTKFDDCINIVERDTEKAQSMELSLDSVSGEEDENGIFHFSSFKFFGCCLLGSGIQPAMIDANVKINEVQFAMDDFIKNIQSELNDKFELFNKTFTKLVNEENNQGGVRNMPETNSTNSNSDFTQTVLGQFEDISVMVSQYESVENRWGESVPRFYLSDIQDDEVIVVDRNDNYRYYGFPFSVSGDKPEIDFACGGKRKKVRYEDYEEGAAVQEGAFDFGKHIADMEEVAFAKVSEEESKVSEVEAKFAEAEETKANVETEYEQIKSEYDEIKPKYDEYVRVEAEREAKELSAQKDAKFDEFEAVLSENAEFSALKEKKDEMSVEDIEKECALMFAKAALSKSSFSKSDSSSAVVGVMDNDDDVPDGYVHTKYGNVRLGR